MKNLLSLTLFFAIVMASSCKKSSSSGSSSGSGSYLSSTVSVSSKTKIVDSFQYDNEDRITQFIQYKYDTTTGTPIETVATTAFTLPTGSAPATGYVYTINGNSLSHTLTYDNQNRVIKDTCPTTGYVATFTYPNGNIATTVLFDGAAMDNQIDTLYLNSGNIATANTWMPNDEVTADSLESSLKFGYSSVANPSYHSATTGTIGPVLYILTVDGLGGSMDPISEKSINSITGAVDGLTTAITVDFTQTTDSKGRLSQLYGSLLTYSETIYFNYSN